jgi:hypothetical protein
MLSPDVATARSLRKRATLQKPLMLRRKTTINRYTVNSVLPA